MVKHLFGSLESFFSLESFSKGVVFFGSLFPMSFGLDLEMYIYRLDRHRVLLCTFMEDFGHVLHDAR